jgi:lupus La protein
VTLRYERRKSPHGNASEADEQYMNPSHRGFSRGGESYPTGVAIVEFESMEGMEAACKDLLINVDEKYAKKQKKEEDGDADGDVKKEEEEAPAGTKVLEIKGNKLVIEKMRPARIWKNKDKGNNKRSRDSVDGDGNEDGDDAAEAKDFEPITVDWEKGCVISVTGISTTSCDRESIRDAVSGILDVSTDAKTSGLYVDYSRGDSDAKLRLKEAKPDKMKELVDKLTDGSVTLGGEKVESAKILEGEEEEKYWKNFISFLNNRKRQRDEEKAQTRKRQKFGGGRGRGRGRRH